MSRPPYHIQAVRQNPDLHDDVSVASNNSSLPSHKPIRKKTSTGSHKALSHPHHGSVAGSNRLHRTASADLGSKTAATLGTKTSAGDKAEKKEEKSTSTSLSKSISLLQKEADQQLELEMETQMTLEHFLGQMISLKNAFAMLSDVVMHEVDAARSESRRRIDANDTRVIANQGTVDKVIHEFGSLSARVGKIEEKQEKILAELSALRVQGDQTAKWLTTVAEQVSVVKDQIAEVNNKQVAFNAETVKECSELKRHWDTQSQTIVSRINECSGEVSKQRSELAVTSEQRMDDLELLEKALSTLQAQQVRLRASVDESIGPLQTETKSLRSKVDQVDASLSAVKMDVVETRHEMEGIDRDARHRFDNVSRVMKVFAEALGTKPPPSIDKGFKD